MSKQTLLFPTAAGDWEIRALQGSGGAASFSPAAAPAKTAADPARAAIAAGNRAIVALPVSQCVILPFWLTEAAPELYEAMILAQLEKRGLASRRGEPPVFDTRIAAQAGGRVLVRVRLLPVDFPDALCFPKVHAYVAGADLLPLPEGRLVLWRERGAVVLAVARGGETVYTQILSRSGRITQETALELRAIRFALETEGIVEAIDGVTLWGDFPEGTGCLELLKLPVQQGERPAPDPARAAAAASRSGIVPRPVRRERAQRARRGRLRRFALLGAAAYVALVLLLCLHLRSLRGQALTLRQSVEADQPAASELERTAAAWRMVESAVNPKQYALEVFRLCSEALPSVGIRFTGFEIKGQTIQIRGVARSAPELFQYVNTLKRNRRLARHAWKVSQPRVFQNNTVEFKISGGML